MCKGDSIFFGILQKRTMHPCIHCIALGKRHLIGKMEEKAFLHYQYPQKYIKTFLDMYYLCKYYKILATLGTNNFEPKRTYCTKSIDSIYFNGPKFCSKYTLIYLQRSYSCLCFARKFRLKPGVLNSFVVAKI